MHGCWSLVNVCCIGRGLCDAPIPRPEESYRLCMFVSPSTPTVSRCRRDQSRKIFRLLLRFQFPNGFIMKSTCMFLVYYIAYDRSWGGGGGGPYTPLSSGLRRQYFGLTLRRLMSYIYGAPILDVSRSHTTTQHSR